MGELVAPQQAEQRHYIIFSVFAFPRTCWAVRICGNYFGGDYFCVCKAGFRLGTERSAPPVVAHTVERLFRRPLYSVREPRANLFKCTGSRLKKKIEKNPLNFQH